jgi:hypothetical protein
MTAEKLHRLRCDAKRDGRDGPPCNTPSETSSGWISLPDFRDYLKNREGWHRRGSRDICPDCWADGYR